MKKLLSLSIFLAKYTSVYSELSISLFSTPDSGNFNGTANVIATGGTSPFTYNWNTVDTISSISELQSSFYYVTVTDANGCPKEDSVFVDFY